MRNTRIAVRALGLLFLFIFGLGVWSGWYSQNFPDIPNVPAERNLSIHDAGYIKSSLMYVNFKERRVQILTLEEPRKDIVFVAGSEFLRSLRLPNGKIKTGWPLPVTFVCGKKPGEECDISQPYDLYVATWKVDPVIIQDNKGGL